MWGIKVIWNNFADSIYISNWFLIVLIVWRAMVIVCFLCVERLLFIELERIFDVLNMLIIYKTKYRLKLNNIPIFKLCNYQISSRIKYKLKLTWITANVTSLWTYRLQIGMLRAILFPPRTIRNTVVAGIYKYISGI